MAPRSAAWRAACGSCRACARRCVPTCRRGRGTCRRGARRSPRRGAARGRRCRPWRGRTGAAAGTWWMPSSVRPSVSTRRCWPIRVVRFAASASASGVAVAIIAAIAAVDTDHGAWCALELGEQLRRPQDVPGTDAGDRPELGQAADDQEAGIGDRGERVAFVGHRVHERLVDHDDATGPHEPAQGLLGVQDARWGSSGCRSSRGRRRRGPARGRGRSRSPGR